MAKLKIEWSEEARLDLFDTLEFYIIRNGSATYSIKLNSKIKKSINQLAKSPLIGVKTEYNSVRALITSDYQIIYEIFDQFILVIMIWDCRRNPEDKLIDKRMKHP